MADYEKIIQETDGWLGKGGLQIMDGVQKAIDEPMKWFSNLKEVEFASENAKTVKACLEYHSTDSLTGFVKNAATEFLESAYGANKCFNSIAHKDLAARGQSFAKKQLARSGAATYRAAVAAHGSYFGASYVEEKMSGFTQTDNFWERLREGEVFNQSWLERIYTAASMEVENLVDSAKAKAKRILKKLERIMYGQKAIAFSREFRESKLPASRLIEVATIPTTMNMLNVGTELAGALVKPVVAPLVMPQTATSALVNASSSIAMKNLGVTGAEAGRYFVGSYLRQSVNVLPSVWNSTGMFTGAWSFLMTAAPYIILAAVIVVAAIEMSKKLAFGNHVYVVKAAEGRVKAATYASFSEATNEDILKEVIGLKNELMEMTGDGLFHAFSFDNENKHQLGCHLAEVVVPMNKGYSENFWRVVGRSKIMDLIYEEEGDSSLLDQILNSVEPVTNIGKPLVDDIKKMAEDFGAGVNHATTSFADILKILKGETIFSGA